VPEAQILLHSLAALVVLVVVVTVEVGVVLVAFCCARQIVTNTGGDASEDVIGRLESREAALIGCGSFACRRNCVHALFRVGEWNVDVLVGVKVGMAVVC